jgi:hypothetical protein
MRNPRGSSWGMCVGLVACCLSFPASSQGMPSRPSPSLFSFSSMLDWRVARAASRRRPMCTPLSLCSGDGRGRAAPGLGGVRGAAAGRGDGGVFRGSAARRGGEFEFEPAAEEAEAARRHSLYISCILYCVRGHEPLTAPGRMWHRCNSNCACFMSSSNLQNHPEARGVVARTWGSATP